MNGQFAELEGVTNAILSEIQGVMGLAQTRLAQWPIRSSSSGCHHSLINPPQTPHAG
ncbi:MAG: hypothetical protein P8074_00245 [Anaerolineales bacterium]|jgi:hypothetical protein